MGECTNLYHHQHNRATGKTVSRNRVECDGMVYFDSALFQRMDQDLTSQLRGHVHLVDIIPEGKHDCPIIDSEEDSSSDEELNATSSPNMSSHEGTRLVVMAILLPPKESQYSIHLCGQQGKRGKFR
jgi:hypothetical protein